MTPMRTFATSTLASTLANLMLGMILFAICVTLLVPGLPQTAPVVPSEPRANAVVSLWIVVPLALNITMIVWPALMKRRLSQALGWSLGVCFGYVVLGFLCFGGLNALPLY